MVERVGGDKEQEMKRGGGGRKKKGVGRKRERQTGKQNRKSEIKIPVLFTTS